MPPVVGASSPARSGGGAGKRRRAFFATTSLEFECLRRKSRYEMLIGEDDISNDVINMARVFNVCLHSRSFPLCADWRKSNSSVDGEPHGNWRWNSSSRDVVASSPSFPPPRRQSAPQSLLAGYPWWFLDVEDTEPHPHHNTKANRINWGLWLTDHLPLP